jgi:hypothetical protein
MVYKERAKGSLKLNKRTQKALLSGVTYHLRDISPHLVNIKKVQGVVSIDIHTYIEGGIDFLSVKKEI